MSNQPSIFVGIASYRDTETQWTLADLFRKATHPDRIVVGICWQFVPGEDDDCFKVETRPDRQRVVKFHASESQGACWARHQVQKLWHGEDYILQIDSHMRFVEGWDEKCLATLADCPSGKALLSTYPPPYLPPDDCSNFLPVMFASEFNEAGILGLRSRAVQLADAPPKPTPSAFVAGGFQFGPGAMWHDVPYDPYLYFQGEEITLAARLWTHGWDIFTPNRVLVYHDYTNRGRPRHWTDQKDWPKLNLRAAKRARHLLRMEDVEDSEALAEIEKYGLGAARDLAAYEAFARLGFKARTIDGKSPAQVESDLAPDRRKMRCQTVFGGIWRSNGWGSPETRSGAGSTLAATRMLRERLPPLFDLLGVQSLCDAGCGDFNWLNGATGRLRHYFGFDVVEEAVTANRTKFGDRKNHFFNTIDITSEQLPEADMILCRDCLTHLPISYVKQALTLFRRSGARYLLASLHRTGAENQDLRVGGWHPYDLTRAPFGLPEPRLTIGEAAEGGTKFLGLWLASDLPQ